MILRAFLILLLLAACGRPLTQTEVAFVTKLNGGTVDTNPIRLVDGMPSNAITFRRPARPRVTCRELILPPLTDKIVTSKPGAVALFNKIYVRKDLFLEDYLRGYPDEISLLATMFLAHEVTHVWQWQNRNTTGYHPLKAASEHGQGKDPYLFELQDQTDFMAFGYEQQASIVEEYVCCRALARNAPRTKRLHDMISQSFPVAGLEEDLLGRAVRLPWGGAEVKGICGEA